jgi:hypothetical protein
VRWIFGGYNFLAIIYQISEYFGGCFWRLVWLLAVGGFFGTTDWSDNHRFFSVLIWVICGKNFQTNRRIDA